MEIRPTKQRLSTGKLTSSVSNWKPSGNCSSGRRRWQKPAKDGRAPGVGSEGPLQPIIPAKGTHEGASAVDS